MGRPADQSTDCENGAIKPWQGEVFVFPATVGQQGFWYLDQLDRGNPAYNIAVRFRLEGPLQFSRARPCDERNRPPSRIAEDDGLHRTDVPVQLVAPSLSISGARRRSPQRAEADRDSRSEVLTVEEAAGASICPRVR